MTEKLSLASLNFENWKQTAGATTLPPPPTHHSPPSCFIHHLKTNEVDVLQEEIPNTEQRLAKAQGFFSNLL